jgi:hypothetical protein
MTILPVRDLQAIVGYVDPASKPKPGQAVKKTRARSAIVVVGMDTMSRVFVLHAWAARCSATALLEEIHRVGNLLKPRPFCVEANAMQSLFVECAEYITKRWGQMSVPISPYHQSTHSEKDFRNRTAIQPVLAQGRLFLREDQQELRAELQTHPRGHLKDLVDSLGSCLALLPRLAQGRTTRQSEAEGLAAYLRANGTPASEIQRRVDHLLAQPN